MERPDPEYQMLGATMLKYVGEPDDMQSITSALDRNIDGSLQFQSGGTDVSKGAIGAVAELWFTAKTLVKRASPLPAKPQSAGEIMVWLAAFASDPDFRPPGWEYTIASLSRHPIPFIRQWAADVLPREVRHLLDEGHR